MKGERIHPRGVEKHRFPFIFMKGERIHPRGVGQHRFPFILMKEERIHPRGVEKQPRKYMVLIPRGKILRCEGFFFPCTVYFLSVRRII